MRAYRFDFDADVTEEQRLLNGTRYLSLEGETAGEDEVWLLSLNFGQPKEPGAPISEGDLTLSGPDGEFFASVFEGHIELEVDEVSGAEREALSLNLRIEGGEDAFDGAQGTVRLAGALSGGRAELRAEIAITKPGEEPDTRGCA